MSAPHPQPVEKGLFTAVPPALIGGRCDAYGALRFPHRGVCAACQGAAVSPVALSTAGTIYTFTIVRHAPPGYVGEVPYALGIVELPEGLRVAATLVADDLSALSIGDVVDFELLPLGHGDHAVLSYAFRRREPAP